MGGVPQGVGSHRGWGPVQFSSVQFGSAPSPLPLTIGISTLRWRIRVQDTDKEAAWRPHGGRMEAHGGSQQAACSPAKQQPSSHLHDLQDALGGVRRLVRPEHAHRAADGQAVHGLLDFCAYTRTRDMSSGTWAREWRQGARVRVSLLRAPIVACASRSSKCSLMLPERRCPARRVHCSATFAASCTIFTAL